MALNPAGPLGVIEAAVAAGEVPGAVCAFGTRDHAGPPMPAGVRRNGGPAATADTRYDLASLTKVISTLPCLTRLISDGQVRLDHTVRHFVSNAGWFQTPSLGDVTVRELLTHSSGLPAWAPLYTRTNHRQTAMGAVFQTALGQRGGVVYSDLGFMVLGGIIERVTGMRQDAFASQVVFGPLGMGATAYGPVPAGVPVAATEDCGWRNQLLQGVVHDENCFALDGVTGHAGLFGTADDLARYAQAWLTLDPLLGSEAVLIEARGVQVEANGARRGLGWLLRSEDSFAGARASPEGFGHTGFTGTSIWIEPHENWFAVLLTNRVHPTRTGGPHIHAIRRAFHEAVAEEAAGPPPRAQG